MKINNVGKFAISVGVSELAGLVGGLFTAPSISSGWYGVLIKPMFNPPSWIFGPVWTILYFIIGVSLYLVWSRDFKIANQLWETSRRPWNPVSKRLWLGDWQKINIVLVFSVQYLLNILWSVVFFGLHRPDFAFFVILALWMSIVYVMINFYRVSKVASWLLWPYILWVSFAMYLNLAIWLVNL